MTSDTFGDERDLITRLEQIDAEVAPIYANAVMRWAAAVLSKSTPPNTVGSGELDAAVKAPLVTEEWAMRMAEREGDTDATTGRRFPGTTNLTPDEIAEMQRLALEDLPAWARNEITRLRALSALPVDHPEVVGVKGADAFDWLETELSAIDCWYRGDPVHEHDAFWFREQAINPVKRARTVFAALRPSDSPALDAGVAVTDAMVEAAIVAFYNKPFAHTAVASKRENMRAALEAALSPTRETGK